MNTSLEQFAAKNQTIGIAELSSLIGRKESTIRTDCTRRPKTLPPRFKPPGTRAVRWRLIDVQNWMRQNALH